jgi:hypothetical protein
MPRQPKRINHDEHVPPTLGGTCPVPGRQTSTYLLCRGFLSDHLRCRTVVTSGNWWKQDEAWRREEWDIAIQLSNGVGLYRIFRDLRQNAWFVEGLYD